ncbi:sensor histidine kinase [Mesobaculum littorinae]|uniref:histidine kinase n=1 Tax=Mesobaculum littorinae TaxID=2486419 RepID=A0A438AHK6_9RHOB|nr:sensor histidine kinase [Mesobaculum littorinae]RVV98172.1 sensor histidine kinase [Mesobaculum littorinae]
MVPGGLGFAKLDRLDVRLVLLLGVALLPVGLIAIAQTYRMIDEANARIEAGLLGETMDAALAERDLIAGTLSSAQNIASVIEPTLDTPDECSVLLSELVEENGRLSFAGVVRLSDGVVVCGSRGVDADVSGSAGYQAFAASPVRSVNAVGNPSISDESVVVIRQPIDLDDELYGYLALSVPHTALPIRPEMFSHTAPRDIMTFNNEGQILTSDRGLDTAPDRLPANRSLSALQTENAAIFTDVDVSGVEQVYTVAPLLRDQVYVLAVWPPARLGSAKLHASTAVAFPLLMWACSLAVAYFAVHSLVIRHIRSLRHRIRVFTSTRRLLSEPRLDDMPAELREVTEAFVYMTDRIIRDEADLENNLHEKDVLLKEVHHRVKNNLQLIASITNMQIRKSRNDETRFVLRRLQDRVMGLAAIHRSLYQATALSQVSADELLSEIANQLAVSGIPAGSNIGFSVELDPVTLYPDQAVPLALLLTESMTNALKYLGRPAGEGTNGKPWIRVALTNQEDGTATMLVQNTIGDPVKTEVGNERSGLGSQLMAAFTMQLGAQTDTEQTDDLYSVRVNFTPSDFSEATKDI